MKTNIIFIGDPHFQVSNIEEVNLFLKKIKKLVIEKQPEIIVIAGDVLHTHERLHTMALNKAYEFIDAMRKISKTYVLVGNHDYCNNQQFLTDNHWMNGIKEWHNTYIIDNILLETINEQKFIFVPYVPAGRFEEALLTLPGESLDEILEDVSCIFAHQEFRGCKMGAIISQEGDKWSLDYPLVISGHIHSKQRPQKNIYYSGSALQNAFGESEKNIIAHVSFNRGFLPDIEEINLGLPRKKIIYMDVDDIDNFGIPETPDKIKLTLKGDYNDFKALKKTKKYKKITEKGIKIVFKPKQTEIEKNNIISGGDGGDRNNSSDFGKILNSLVMEQKNIYLFQLYELIINNKSVLKEDILFL